MVAALKELQAFEEQADAEIAKLALWRQPIRSILSLIYLSADGQYVGTRFNRKGRRNDEVGTAMITRMSYVACLFGKCSREIGADIDDALSVVDERFKTDIEQLASFISQFTLFRRAGNQLLEYKYVSKIVALIATMYSIKQDLDKRYIFMYK